MSLCLLSVQALTRQNYHFCFVMKNTSFYEAFNKWSRFYCSHRLDYIILDSLITRNHTMCLCVIQILLCAIYTRPPWYLLCKRPLLSRFWTNYYFFYKIQNPVSYWILIWKPKVSKIRRSFIIGFYFCSGLLKHPIIYRVAIIKVQIFRTEL